MDEIEPEGGEKAIKRVLVGYHLLLLSIGFILGLACGLAINRWW
jgi:hypothetical protein